MTAAAPRRFWTWAVPPPVRAMTPDAARRWFLLNTYWRASSLCEMQSMLPVIAGVSGWRLPKRDLEPTQGGLRILSADVQTITEAAGRSLATGRTVHISFEPEKLGDHRKVARELKLVARFARAHGYLGMRGLLNRGIAERARLLRKGNRHAA